MAINNPYHEGELNVQRRANEVAIAQINAAAIDKTILAGALRFIEQQPMVIVGSVDQQGRVWSSILTGKPGFTRALNDQTLEINLTQPTTAEDDPLWRNLLHNQSVGLLVIELGSRRRIRINGRVRKNTNKYLIIEVERAYPNCPKYIQRRDWKRLDTGEPNDSVTCEYGKKLGQIQRALIEKADTFFVTSAHPEHGIDASHRGGQPGFVQIINNQQLRIPDFAGNSMFNTLGNFTSYPYAGLIFIDFETGQILQLTGQPEILWQLDDPQNETGGTHRYWQLDITCWRQSTLPHRFVWEFLDASPYIPEHRKTQTKNSISLTVKRIQQETDRVKSFCLRASDNRELPAFQAGAHIQVHLKLLDGSITKRHYSLLNSPADRKTYEIAVLKEPDGRGGSLYMHEQIHQGDVLQVSIPKNEFTMTTKSEHNILIAGGIGITPIVSMLHKLTADNKSCELHYSASTFSDLALRQRVEQLAGDRAHFYATKEPDGRRMDIDKIMATPRPGVQVYVCGPRGLINAVRNSADLLGWPSAQIHFESFHSQPLPGDRPIRVKLVRSNKVLTVPAERTILDTLLEAGISVPHTCKRGECTMCTTQVVSGVPDHRDLCLTANEKKSSMCLCVSRARTDDLALDL